MEATDKHIEIIIKPRSSIAINWQELWQYRELLYFFAWKDIKVRYKQALLGIAWTLLQPLALMIVFIILLKQGIGVATGNIPAPLFYLSGLIIWNLFNHAVTNAASSMVSNAAIIKKIYFPRLIIPISSVIVASFDFLIGLILFLGLLTYYHINGAIAVYWLKLIPSLTIAFIITSITSFSIGTFLSAINVKYRDVRYALPFLIQSLFFITPVIFDSQSIKTDWVAFIIKWNPLYWAINILRNTIGGNKFQMNYPDFFFMSILLSAMLLSSIFMFKKTESYFADIV